MIATSITTGTSITETAAMGPTPARGSTLTLGERRLSAVLLARREFQIVLVMVVIVAVSTLAAPEFPSSQVISNMFMVAMLTTFVALGQTRWQTLKSQGVVGKIGVFGIGDPNPNRRYFEDGSLTGLFLGDEVKQGQLIAYVARAVADGKMPPAGRSFTVGDLGTSTVTNDSAPNTSIFSKPLEFTKDNYKQYDF